MSGKASESEESGSKNAVAVEDLKPSELGTKNYWEDNFKDELNDFKNHGIIGDVWFGEDIMYKVVNYLSDCHLVTEESKIVDLGCGNGVMILELAREGFKNLTGLDYSENAIELSKTLVTTNEHDATFKMANLLEEPDKLDLGKYDVCLDKGTFDAISLCPDLPQSEARAKYFTNVVNLMTEQSIFILTSCNWTTPELISMSADYLKVQETIPTPQFMFGGKCGNVVSIVVFNKK
ncbi:Protein-lysine N-methyltransferase mettl10 [Orchesella cincta]|uniref:Protein-lysine N-methyltransferase Ocin01_08732 n=1 Tax=Orchesella cincta TaxID=48709 RepID=A0A1D2MY39_ORCCI|nr:Protein-lysine N-methyltransferase mettl10 [Orchesella cincta]